MTEPTPKPGWMGWLNKIALAILVLVGSGSGGYLSNQEMMQSQALFQAEVRAWMQQSDHRLQKLEEAIDDQ